MLYYVYFIVYRHLSIVFARNNIFSLSLLSCILILSVGIHEFVRNRKSTESIGNDEKCLPIYNCL